ncbi:hypothetical protein V2J09_010992 [Rumex salicifolius]
MSVKDPIAYARVEVIKGSDMKPSDPNGLADPYVKGQLGLYRFMTKVQRKTLVPKWIEEFNIPIISWESDNILNMEVRDKDPFLDDSLGDCCVDISQFRDGQRHDMWVPLENIKMGRLHLAITVVDAESKGVSGAAKDEKLGAEVREKEMSEKACGKSKESQKFGDKFEAIDVEGQKETGIWIHHPGSDISKTWEPRKRRSRRQLDTIEIHREVCEEQQQGEEGVEDGSGHGKNIFSKGLQIINGAFRKSQKRDKETSEEDSFPSPHHANVKAVDSQRIGVRLVVEECSAGEAETTGNDREDISGGGSESSDSPTHPSI